MRVRHIGSLRHKVYIRPAVKSQTGKKDTEFTFAPVDTDAEADAYASIEPIRGRELIVARGIRADVTHTITFRYVTSIPPNQMCQIFWLDDTGLRSFNLGPEVNDELRNVYRSFYATEIR